jgi:2-methylaconitate cis-trans-isomerase PrpF
MLAAVSRSPSAADIAVRLRVVGRTHAALAGSGGISTAAFMLIDGTIPARYGPPQDRGRIRIEHPAGVMDVVTRRESDGTFSRLALQRTARRLMDGRAYV